MSAFVAKFYEVIIAILGCLVLILAVALCYESWQSNHYKTQLENAELKCKQDKDAIHTNYQTEANKAQKAYQEALLQQQHEINQLSTDYEQAKAERQSKLEYRIREVQKIVERPVYINNCTDNDGVSELNSLIKSRSAS